MSHPPELKVRARELRDQKMLIKDISLEIGVPEPTVARWLNKKLEERGRAIARKKKFSEGKKCPTCRRRMTNNASHCVRCARAKQRYWTRERVIDAIRDWAIEHGEPPKHSDWSRSGPNNPAISSLREGPNPVFTKWSDALRAAGFDPFIHKRRGRGKLSPAQKQQRAEARRKARELKIKDAVKREAR